MKIKLVLFGFSILLASHTSFAQVFSSDGTGYVNVTLKPGYNLVANPIDAGDNSIGALFKNMQGGVPDGTMVYKLVNGNFVVASYIDLIGSFEPADAAAETIGPGDGVWVYLPGNADKVVTFVGKAVQGQICSPVPHGFSIKSNLVPLSQSLYTLIPKPDISIDPTPSQDVVFIWTDAKNFMVYQVNDLVGGFDSPTIKVGQAFFYYRNGAATTWCRTFVITPP